MKDKVQLEACSQPVLVHTVKAVDKLGLKCTQGSWKEYVKALPGPSSKFNDPARQQQQHLQDFLASLEASDEYKKPKKLLASLLSYYSSLQKEADTLPVGHPLHPHQVTPGGSSKGPLTSSSRTSGQQPDTASRPDSSSNGANDTSNGAAAVGSKRVRPEAAATAGADPAGVKGATAEVPPGKKAKRSKAAAAAAAAAAPAANGAADHGSQAASEPAAAAADGAAGAAAGEATAGSSGSIHPVWQLVLRTQQHPDYARLYTFPSWQKGWKRTSRLPPPDLSAPPELLGLDCEMCATSAGDKVLLAAALVDQQKRTLVRQLVQPEGTILDLRSSITGITQQQLAGIQLDRLQLLNRYILPRLGPGVVLVGHALHNDLNALQLDHQPVIDTSLLFSYKGLAAAKPSLVHLVSELLGQQLRGADGTSVHDVYEDASATLALVERELLQESPTPPLPPPAVKVDKALLSQLLVHRIPAGVTRQELQAALQEAAGKKAPSCQLLQQPASADAGDTAGQDNSSKPEQQQQQDEVVGSKQVLVFKHPGDMEAFFQALPGAVTTDSVGRRTKQLQVAGSKALVRKMAAHAGLAFGKDLVKDRGASTGKKSKKKKYKKVKGNSGRKRAKPGK